MKPERYPLSKKVNRSAILVAVVLCGGVAVGRSPEMGGTSFGVSWSTIDGGGGMRSTGGEYELSGTIGQPNAGTGSGGGLAMRGGFWLRSSDTAPIPAVSDDA